MSYLRICIVSYLYFIDYHLKIFFRAQPKEAFTLTACMYVQTAAVGFSSCWLEADILLHDQIYDSCLIMSCLLSVLDLIEQHFCCIWPLKSIIINLVSTFADDWKRCPRRWLWWSDFLSTCMVKIMMYLLELPHLYILDDCSHFVTCFLLSELDWSGWLWELKNWDNWTKKKRRIIHQQKSSDTWNCWCLNNIYSVYCQICYWYFVWTWDYQ